MRRPPPKIVDDPESLLIESLRRRPPQKSSAGLSVEKAAAELQRGLIENLRRNLLDPGEREFLANALEALWFPSSERVKGRKALAKATVRQWTAELYRREYESIAAAESIPIYEAKKILVKRRKLQSVEAMGQYIKRVRQEQRRGVQKRGKK